MKNAEERREGYLMPTDTERREVAARLRECKRTKDNPTATFDWAIYAALDPEWYRRENWIPYNAAVDRLADLIEPSEADEWVEEHGGLDEVRRHHDRCETWWHDKARMFELCADAGGVEALEGRLMPEGMEWPKVDGKPVDFKTAYVPSLGVLEAVSIYNTGACQVMSHDGIIKSAKDIHIVKPKVLDADGVPIKVGDTVYEVEGTGHAYKVVSIRVGDGSALTPTCVTCDEGDGTSEHFMPDHLTHRAPVLAADGKPLEVGQTVWTTRDHDEFTVVDPSSDVEGFLSVKCTGKDGETYFVHPGDLTHTKPEPPDSWERLEEDANKNYIEYWKCDGIPCYDCPAIVDGKRLDERYNSANCSEAVKCDLVRRAKALADKEER